MKRNYTLTLEFETETDEEVSEDIAGKFKDYKDLLETFLKNEEAVTDIYRNLVISDVCCESHIFKVAVDKIISKIKDEFGILKRVLNKLPEVKRNYFFKIMKGENYRANEFFEDIFLRFGEMKLIGMKFCKSGGSK